jgi:hypothetical protein
MFRFFVALFLVAVSFPAHAQAESSFPTTSTSTREGRYQIIIGQYRRDIYMLDTHTGQVWVLTSMTSFNGDPSAWVIMDRIDSPADYTAMQQRYGRKAQPTAPASAQPAPRPSARQ